MVRGFEGVGRRPGGCKRDGRVRKILVANLRQKRLVARHGA